MDKHIIINKALREHLSGDLLAAEMGYREILSQIPDNAEAKHLLGFLLQQTGQLDEAREHLHAAIALDNSHAEWHFNLGIVLSRKEQFIEAIESFSNAISIDPSKYFYWTNLGVCLEANGQDRQAEYCYKAAIDIDQNKSDAFFLLSKLYSQLKQFDDAKYFNYRGIVASPHDAPSKIVLGQAYFELGDIETAVEIFKECLKQNPHNAIAHHLLKVSAHQLRPDRCPNAFVEQTFDAAANNFEKNIKALGYSGPELVKEYLSSKALSSESLSILDLGCGTGLVGEVLKPYAFRLVGVDLSQAMLDIARNKAIYHDLYAQDVLEFLTTSSNLYDVISCMDTFVYIGNLADVFIACARSLKKGGTLIFSTEKSNNVSHDYELNISGRYSHNENYIKTLLDKNNFDVKFIQNITIRMEAGFPLDGQFICATLSYTDDELR